MKTANKIYISLTFLLLGSCSFLDENPDNRVALDDLDKAAQLLVSGYSIASPNFTDWMTDDATWTLGTNIRLEHEQMFRWEEVTAGGPTVQDTPDFYWFETYNAIAHANEVLAIIDDLPLESDEDAARKDAIEGEALLIRAYGHFMLVNMFGEHFDTQSAGSDDGVPYIKDPETEFLVGYERESVRKVYSEIEDDLLKGLPLIDDTFYNNSGKYHFTRNAALAFATRFYLFQRDFQRVIQYADQLLGANPSAFIRDLTASHFRNASSSITEYPRLYSSPEEGANLLLMRKISLVQRPDFAFGVDRNEYSAIFNQNPFSTAVTDRRENPAFVKGQNALYPVRYQSLFERASLNSNVGFPYYIHMAFTGEEVLLNRAEAKAFTGDNDGAIEDLQVLTNRRYDGGDITLSQGLINSFIGFNGTQDDDFLNVINYIITERRKEFIMQGLRWYDIKRFGFAFQHITPAGVSQLTADDPRKIMQIPQSAIEVGGLEPNPR